MNNQLQAQQLRPFIPLNQFSLRQLQALEQLLQLKHFWAGETVFDLAEQDKNSYFLLSGSLQLTDKQGEQKILQAGDETSCYEISPDKPRQYQAVASTDASLFCVDSDKLAQLLAWQQSLQDVLLELGDDYEDVDWLSSLLANPLFSTVPAQNIKSMLERMQLHQATAGSEIIKQGDTGQSCYFLRSGRAKVERITPDNETELLAELSMGACFGEEALLSEQPRNASVTMLEDGQILELPRNDFLQLLKEPVVAQSDLPQAQQLVSQQQGLWLDVRRQDEYEQAHAMGAVNMPLALLRLKARLLDKSKEYICYCNDGRLGQNAVYLLKQLGYQAKMLAGGLNALTPEQRQMLLTNSGSGFLLRSNGCIERSN